MNAFNVMTKLIKWIIPVILFLVFFFYWDTQHNLDGLWIYCGWMTLLFWQIFSGKVNLARDMNKLNQRIQSLEAVVMGKMEEESFEADKRKKDFGGGLAKRVEVLEKRYFKPHESMFF